MQSTNCNLSCSVKLDLDLLNLWRVSANAAARDDDGISQDILGYPWLTMLRQDCCMILPPYPFSLGPCLGDPTDMSLEDAWHARPQLFFNGRSPKHPSWTSGPDDIEACLVFFSTFEELKLPATGPLIMPPPSCTSRPLLLSCTSPPAKICLAGCHSFPVSCKTTLLPPYLTSYCTSRPARFSTG